MIDGKDLSSVKDFIKKGFAKNQPFRFTVDDLSSTIKLPTDYCSELLSSLNGAAQFWKGKFNFKENIIVSSAVFKRLFPK